MDSAGAGTEGEAEDDDDWTVTVTGGREIVIVTVDAGHVVGVLLPGGPWRVIVAKVTDVEVAVIVVVELLLLLLPELTGTGTTVAVTGATGVDTEVE